MKESKDKKQNIFKSVADRLTRIFGKEEAKELNSSQTTDAASEQDAPVSAVDNNPVAENPDPNASDKPKIVRRSRIRVRRTKSKAAEKEKNEMDDATSPIYELPSEEIGSAIYDYVLAHLSDENLNVDLMATQLKVSRTNLYTLVHREFGVTPANLILNLRLNYAAALLKEGLKVREVAMKCGFIDPKYFSKVFKKYYGILPSNYGA